MPQLPLASFSPAKSHVLTGVLRGRVRAGRSAPNFSLSGTAGVPLSLCDVMSHNRYKLSGVSAVILSAGRHTDSSLREPLPELVSSLRE